MGLWEDHVAASYTSSGRASWRRTSSIYTWLWKVGRHLRPNRTPRWSKICKFTFFSLYILKVPWKDASTRTIQEPANGVFLIFSCFQWLFFSTCLQRSASEARTCTDCPRGLRRRQMKMHHSSARATHIQVHEKQRKQMKYAALSR